MKTVVFVVVFIVVLAVPMIINDPEGQYSFNLTNCNDYEASRQEAETNGSGPDNRSDVQVFDHNLPATISCSERR